MPSVTRCTQEGTSFATRPPPRHLGRLDDANSTNADGRQMFLVTERGNGMGIARVSNERLAGRVIDRGRAGNGHAVAIAKDVPLTVTSRNGFLDRHVVGRRSSASRPRPVPQRSPSRRGSVGRRRRGRTSPSSSGRTSPARPTTSKLTTLDFSWIGIRSVAHGSCSRRLLAACVASQFGKVFQEGLKRIAGDLPEPADARRLHHAAELQDDRLERCQLTRDRPRRPAIVRPFR